MSGVQTRAGIAYGLGVGPGDPELITLKALRVLRRCPVVAYPAPETGPSLARRIVAPHLDGCAPLEYAIRMPMEAARFPAAAVYDRAAAELGAHLTEGRDVAVLCQGDPFFYGSFMYLFARLATRFTVEVVPGVSSLTACAAMLHWPLAARDDVLSVIPATLPEADLAARLAATDAAAIIKLGRHLPKLRRVLDALGLTASARYIERATLPEQAIRPLADLADDAAPYFATVLVHRRGGAVDG
jgi:precorrin-2/cobalt-factor-2 C20-methyltransferase